MKTDVDVYAVGDCMPFSGAQQQQPSGTNSCHVVHVSLLYTLQKHPKVSQDIVFRTLDYPGKGDRFVLTQPCWWSLAQSSERFGFECHTSQQQMLKLKALPGFEPHLFTIMKLKHNWLCVWQENWSVAEVLMCYGAQRKFFPERQKRKASFLVSLLKPGHHYEKHI